MGFKEVNNKVEVNQFNQNSGKSGKPSLLTVRDVAAQLNISTRRVRAIAKQRHEQLGIGWQVPGRNIWLFRPDEVELLRPGTSGRPKKGKEASYVENKGET